MWVGDSALLFKIVRTAATDKMKPHLDLQFSESLSGRVEWIRDGTQRGCPSAAEPNDMHPALFRPPADANSPAQLLNMLNDHLLLTIIEQKRLGFADLLALSGTCTRLLRLAKRYIAAHHRDAVNRHLNDIAFAPIWQIEQYLRRFGDLITSVEVNNVLKRDRLVIGLVEAYCSNVTDIRCIFSDTLGRWSDFGDLLGPNSKLTSLSVASLERGLTMPRFHIPGLVEVRLEHGQLAAASSIESFFAHNPQIRRVTMKNVWITDVRLAGRIRWAGMDSLTFHSACITDSINLLAALERADAQLRRLVLEEAQLALGDEMVYNLIGRLKELTCLRLHGSDVMILRFSNVIKLVLQLPMLREFVLASCALTFRHLRMFLQRTESIPLRHVSFVMYTAIDWNSAGRTLRNIRRLAAARHISVKVMVVSTVSLSSKQKAVG